MWLQCLESDDSNINKTVWNELYEQISALPERKAKDLVNLSTCNIDLCYGAFQMGLQVFGEDLSELVISFHIGFKPSTSRCEEYEEFQRKLGLPAHKFLKHVESRWPILGPGLSWIIEQFDSLKQYFLADVPAKQPSILHNKTHKNIMGHTKYPTILSVVKAGIFLIHSNAEVEKGFSGSGKTVTVDRTFLSKASINNLWTVTNGLKVAVCHTMFQSLLNL